MSDATTLGNTTIQPLDAEIKHDPTAIRNGTAPSNDTATSSGSASGVNGTALASQQNVMNSLAKATDTVVNCQFLYPSPCHLRPINIFLAASATISNISNSQTVQDLKNVFLPAFMYGDTDLTHIAGPVAQNVSVEASKTGDEFKDLANSRQIPETTAANGQKLTNYHSFFYRLLSWQNPRATGITFVANILLIFLARYMNVLSYFFKFSFIILGVTSGLEVAGKVLFDDGLASKMRPRKYWTIPRESLERMTEDVEQLINFFVIEIQRILYAENVYATLAVFSAAFLSYWLIKLVPFWGLTLISTLVVYLTPLVYIKNREAIDNGLNHAGEVIGSQASQIKKITTERTNSATKSVQSYAEEYSSKAQEYMGSKKQQVSASASNASDSLKNSASNANDSLKSNASNASDSLKSSTSTNSTSLNSSSTAVNSNDFPAAPQQAPGDMKPTGSLAQSSADPLFST